VLIINKVSDKVKCDVTAGRVQTDRWKEKVIKTESSMYVDNYYGHFRNHFF